MASSSTAIRVRSKRGAAFALAASFIGLAACLPGCDQPASAKPVGGGEALVFVQLPCGALEAHAAASTFRDPYPAGARLMVWDPTRPKQPARVLTPEFASAGAPSVDAEGRRVLFIGKRAPSDAWRVHEIPIAGGVAVPISPAGANATSAAYLPGGKVVFSCDLARTLDPHDGAAAHALYTARTDGAELARVTFNPYSDIDPTVLADGRILYAAWQAPGSERPAGGTAFLTIFNDGTGVSAFFGSHDGPVWKRRARQIGTRLVFLAGDGAEALDELGALALSRPLHSRTRLAPTAAGRWRSVEDYDGERMAVTRRDLARADFGVFLLDPRSGVLETLLDDPHFDELDAVFGRAREPARGHLSLVDAEQSTGELLCLDARLTDRAPSGAVGRAANLIVLSATPQAWAGDAASSGDARAALQTQLVARLPLGADGSAFFEVPADTPLAFRTEDADGRVVFDSGGWVWVRPGEKRGCIGCHEDRERAPTNRFPDALAGDDPLPMRHDARGVSLR